jgi:hypothetical protein
VTVDKIVQHMRNIKISYQSAIQWRNQTGQGILENEEDGESVVKSI